MRSGFRRRSLPDSLTAASVIIDKQDIETPSHSGSTKYRITTRNQTGAVVLSTMAATTPDQASQLLLKPLSAPSGR